MDHDNLRRWLWADPSASAPGDPARVLLEVEKDHAESVWREHNLATVRVLSRSEQRPAEVEVLPRGIGALSRCTVPELIARHERVLVVGGRRSGKTALIARLAARAAVERHQGRRARVPFVVPVSLLAEPRLDEHAIAKLSPIGGVRLVRRALEERRALVLVDGLDEAGSDARALAASIEVFAAANPGNRIVVTTRPRRAGLPGPARTELRGFVTATLLPQPGSSVIASHRFLARRDPARRTALIASTIDALLESAAGELPAGSLLGSLDLDDRRSVFSAIALQMHIDELVELDDAALADVLRERLEGACWVDGSRLVLSGADEDDDDDDDDDDGDHDDDGDYGEGDYGEGDYGGGAFDDEEGDFDDEEERDFDDEDEGDYDDEGDDGGGGREAPVGALGREAAGGAGEPGGIAQDIDGMVERLLGEIRQRQVLLIERRPGFFSFVDLSYQEYLNALDHVRIGALEFLIEMRDDAWFHESIVHAAALPGVDAAAFIQQILDADWGAAPVPTLLAARCAEVAGEELPARLRNTISRRLADLVPPRNADDVARLIDLGEITGAALVQALASASPSGRARTAIVLGGIRYRPAYGVLVRMAADDTPVKSRILCRIWMDEVFVERQVVGCFALLSLFDIALAAPAARTLFQQAIEHVPRGALAFVYRFIHHRYMWMSLPNPEDEPRDMEAVGELLARMSKELARAGGAPEYDVP